MYTLGGGIDEEQGWGRAGDSRVVLSELAAYGAGPGWFGLGDLDIATHLHRTSMLAAGLPLSAVTAVLCQRWQPGVRLLPMSDDRVETHVVLAGDEGEQTVHFQEWWVRMGAQVPAARLRVRRGGGCVPGAGGAGGDRRGRRDHAAPVQPRGEHRHDPRRARDRRGDARQDRGRGITDHRRRAGARHGRQMPGGARRGCHRGRGRRRTTGPRCSTAGWSTSRTRPRPTHRNWPASRSARSRCT